MPRWESTAPPHGEHEKGEHHWFLLFAALGNLAPIGLHGRSIKNGQIEGNIQGVLLLLAEAHDLVGFRKPFLQHFPILLVLDLNENPLHRLPRRTRAFSTYAPARAVEQSGKSRLPGSAEELRN